MREGLATIGVVTAFVLAAPAPAQAERSDHDPAMLAIVARPKKLQRSYSQQIADRLTALGDELDAHLGELSLDRFDLKFDGRARRAKLRLGKGDGENLSMRIDGDVLFDDGMAKVDAKIDLRIGGHRMQLELPQVDFVPRSWEGEHYLEVRLPIIHGQFEPEKWITRLTASSSR